MPTSYGVQLSTIRLLRLVQATAKSLFCVVLNAAIILFAIPAYVFLGAFEAFCDVWRESPHSLRNIGLKPNITNIIGRCSGGSMDTGVFALSVSLGPTLL